MTSQTIHRALAALVADQLPAVVADLGCGRGDTLVELAALGPGSALLGLDVAEQPLQELEQRLPGVRLVRHDLAARLPVEDGAVDVVVSHNTLECLADPSKLLVDIGRVLRPGGRAVLEHTDFETLTVVTTDRDLARRVLLTYAEMPVPYSYMSATDPQMGRRLAGLVRRSPLALQAIEAHTTVIGSLAQAWEERLREVTQVARRGAQQERGHVTLDELTQWERELTEAEVSGEFLFSETTFLATATKSIQH